MNFFSLNQKRFLFRIFYKLLMSNLHMIHLYKALMKDFSGQDKYSQVHNLHM